jgi:hypothetical protein
VDYTVLCMGLAALLWEMVGGRLDSSGNVGSGGESGWVLACQRVMERQLDTLIEHTSAVFH